MALQEQCCLTKSNLDGFKEWFFKYVKSFYSSDPTIQDGLELKEKHSLRVCSEILKIGSKLNLSQNDLRIAETVALFHDIGRFEQFSRFQTFADKKSANHGELGVKVLEQEKVLEILEKDTQELILKAVLYHNRLKIPENEDSTCLFFSKLIRDADKLDIYNLVSTYYYLDNSEKKNSAIELDLPDNSEISVEVLNGLHQGNVVSNRVLRSANDFKLLQLGWVYDINFQPTFQMIYERNYLQKIKDTLPPTKEIDDIYAKLISYLKENSAKP